MRGVDVTVNDAANYLYVIQSEYAAQARKLEEDLKGKKADPYWEVENFDGMKRVHCSHCPQVAPSMKLDEVAEHMRTRCTYILSCSNGTI